MISALIGTRFVQLARRNAEPPPSGYERIDDKLYKVELMPDGKVWMCENLDYGSSGIYYNNDEPTYGWNGLKYGKLYTWDEAVAAANAISGWHLPSTAECNALLTAVGGASVAGTKLKSTTGWFNDEGGTDGNGTDDYGFSVFPFGRYSGGSFENLGYDAYFWTANEYVGYPTAAYSLLLWRGASSDLYSYAKTTAHSVRLVKD